MIETQSAIRIRNTPNCRHPYTATMKGRGEYGWGNTPAEARECLLRQLDRREPIGVTETLAHLSR